jgi:hypothetical protein
MGPLAGSGACSRRRLYRILIDWELERESTMKTRIIRCAGLAVASILAPAAMAATFTVTNTNDSGVGSLRDAINQANGDPVSPVKIDFNVPAGPGGVVVIAPQTPLPIIRNIHGHGIVIDGFTQPGSSVIPGNPSSPAVLGVKVVLDGSAVGIPAPPLFAHGLHIMSSGNKVQGLCVHSFPHDGISIQGIPLSPTGPSGANGNYIQWNLVGTDVTGTAAKPNGHRAGGLWGGIYVKVLPGAPGVANQNQILENVVSGNTIEGVGISNCPDQGSDVQQNHVERCLIGIDITGSLPLGNGHDGVYIGEGAHHNVIEQNWIGANGFEGVGIVGYGPSGLLTHNNLLLRNKIGVDVNLNPLPNQRHGVAIGSYGGTVWGFAPSNTIDQNIIAYNQLAGIAVDEAGPTGDNDTSGNKITANAIYLNGMTDPGHLGIDLAFEPTLPRPPGGVTANDTGDPDQGPNGLMNFPVITSAIHTAGTTTVSGTIDPPGYPATIEVFRAIPGNYSQHGQGAVFLGSTNATGPSWTIALTGAQPGQLLTATASDTAGNTSEFSLNAPVWDDNQQQLDYGDAPDPSYPTLAASNGARHQIIPGMFLGNSVDGEIDGQPNASATGDDNDGNDDGDGVTFPQPLTPGGQAQIDVVASVTGRLDAWVDFDGNGTWAPAEQILTGAIHPGGGMQVSYSFTVPPAAMPGNTFARIRHSSGGGLLPNGPAPDGEVEDHMVTIQQEQPEQFDWGDAPDPTYPTLLANNGARHLIVIGGPMLGNAIDAEPDGQPTNPADGDDNNILYPGVPDDEDGVLFPTALISSVPSTVQVSSATGGILQGWIDWNGDGDWADTGEQVITNRAIPAGVTSVPITVPWGATGGPNGLTYARFRISNQQWVGFAGSAPDGEVEDYQVRLEALKWLQIPEQGQEGVDVSNAAHTLADDFQCTASGLITDIHLWGSFLGDNLPEEGPGGLTFEISVWSDVPVGPGNPVPHSHPGQKLWQMKFNPGQYSAGQILNVVPGEWWHDPGTQNWVPKADQNIYQFDFYPPKDEAFVQEEGTIYWLAVKFSYTGPSQWTGKFGWKTTPSPWNDDACYQNPASPAGWTDMIYQQPHPWWDEPNPLYRSVNLAFALSGEPRQEETADYGDAPDDPLNPNDYPTLAASNGASHLLGSQFHLGFPNIPPDGETDGQPTAPADGDDINGAVPDDEDGVTFQSWLIPGVSAAIKVDLVTPAGIPGYLNGWIDYNRDGDWSDPGENFIIDQAYFGGPTYIGFVVPSGVSPGATYARFRFTSQTLASLGLNEGGQAPDGEVEDYRVDILHAPNGVDFGDAPDAPFPTFTIRNGARHLIVPGYHMGVTIDAEPDGQPSPAANGDDITPPAGPDDEDGVYFYPLIIGQQSAIDASVTGNGFIDAWIDFNGNGSWLDPGEQIASAVPVITGLNQITFSLPAGTVPISTYARVRFSSAGGLAPSGAAQNGEVEDYWVNIQPVGAISYDFGDAPDPLYPTLAASNGARHLIGGPLWLGTVVDPEPDGQPTANADGDDLNLLYPGAPDDEDGVLFAYALIGGKSSMMQVIASASGFIDLWIDWNGNGSWADLGDNVLSHYAVTPGPNYITIGVPAVTFTGSTKTRVRLSSAGYLPPTGFAQDGEVEDHDVFLYEEGGMDFGDAPNSSISPSTNYETTMMDFGAAHFIDSVLFLGMLVDSEIDGQPSPGATGDDLAKLADEDGVTFASPWISGVTAQAVIMVNPAAPGPIYDLDLWVDWNGDGSWAQPSDHVLAARPVMPGPNPIVIQVPTGLSPKWSYARFRLTHPGSGVGHTGYVFGGEVEDYMIPIGSRIPATITVNTSVSPAQAVLTWSAASGATSYSVYSSTNLGAGFPNPPNWKLETTTANLTWSDPIAVASKFYIVVAFP